MKLLNNGENSTTLKAFFAQYHRLIGVLLVYVTISCFYMQQLDITSDEGEYYGYNCHWIKGVPERLTYMEDSKTPITSIALVPRIIKQLIDPNFKSFTGSENTFIKSGRYFMLIYAFFLGIYFFLFLQNIFKIKSNYIPLILLLFDPLVLGFSPVIGSDIANGLFTLTALYYCCRYLQLPNKKYLIAASIAIGLGLTNKVSFIFVALIITCFYLILFLIKKDSITIQRFYKFLKKGIIAVIIVLLVINAAFYFHRTAFKLKGSFFLSRTMLNAAANPLINSIPIPLPYAYVQSYDLLQRSKEAGGCVNSHVSTYNGVFIAGNYQPNGPIPYYYLVCMLYKIPLSIFLLAFASAFAIYKKRTFIKLKPFHLLIITVAIGMFLSLSFLNPFQSGIRHLLIIYPIGYLFLAVGLDKLLQQYNLSAKLFIATACIYQLISVGLYFPNLIGYTNELLWNKTDVYKTFCDGNINYEQIRLPNYFYVDTTKYIKAPAKPTAGNFGIYQDDMHPCDSMGNLSIKWIRRFTPIGNYKYSILLFHITEDDIKEKKF